MNTTGATEKMKLSTRVGRIGKSATMAAGEKARRLRDQGVEVLDLGPGQPDFDTPEHIREAGIRAIRERASSGFWLIVSGFVGVSIAVRVRALISASDYRDRTGIVALGVFIADTGLSLANVLGLTEQIAAAVYLTALMLRLFLSGLAFSSVISSFLTPSEPGR